MSQTAITIRMDSDLKDQFDSLCDEFGMSTDTAFNIFVRTVVRMRVFPKLLSPSKKETLAKSRAAFDKLRKCAVDNGLSGMTLEDINEDIRLTREEK